MRVEQDERNHFPQTTIAIPIITDTTNAAIGPARFSVSNNGAIVWQGQWERKYQLRYFDSEDRQTGSIKSVELVSGPLNPNVSPDGKRVVFQTSHTRLEVVKVWLGLATYQHVRPPSSSIQESALEYYCREREAPMVIPWRE